MSKLDVILLAGGGGDALARGAGLTTKALIPIHGKPMLEWVIEAFRRSDSIRHIVVAGPPALERLPAMRYVRKRVPAGRSMLLSFLSAALYIKSRLHRTGALNGYLVSCCDAVFLTPEVIETAVANIRTARPDIALHYVERGTFERAGLHVHRTFLPVGDGEYTGTTLYYVRKLRSVVWAAGDLRRARQLRKQPAKLLALLGAEPRSPMDVQRILSARLSLQASVFVIDRPEAGMDVDKPEDLELAHRWLPRPEGDA